MPVYASQWKQPSKLPWRTCAAEGRSERAPAGLLTSGGDLQTRTLRTRPKIAQMLSACVPIDQGTFEHAVSQRVSHLYGELDDCPHRHLK